ncbi:MAG: hypothetical protein ACOCW3_04335 [Spirochaetota bacterium]
MRTSSGKRFALLVSLPPDNRRGSPHPTARALELIDAIERSGVGAVPIAWHLPAADAVSGDRPDSGAFRDALQRRLAETGDALLPMGLTGAPHVALHVGEIEADLAWSVSNIWTTGVTDALRLDPPLLVPAAPDTLRPEALAAYGAADAPVGILGEDRTGLWISVVPNAHAGSGGALPLLDAAALPGTEITARVLARAIARRRREARSLSVTDAQLVVRIALGPHDDERRALALATASAELSERQGWSLVGLSVDRTAPAPLPRLLARARATITPEVGEHATAMRRRRASKINTRRILEAVAYGHANLRVGPGTADPPENGRREFIASMLGNAVIPGTTVEARFDGGRLCGLHSRSAPRRRDRPARSELVRQGRRTQDTVPSCFSFETAVSRGLRAEAEVDDVDLGTVARIRTEYALVDEHDALVAGQRVLVDGGAPDAVLYVLATPVLHAGACAVTGRFADGTTYDHELPFDREELVLWGDALGIRDGESRYTLLALGSDGRPVTWNITALRDPEPRFVLGGRYEPRGGLDTYTSLLLVRGEIDHELVTKAMAGRLPADITVELAAARASESAIRDHLTPERREA